MNRREFLVHSSLLASASVLARSTLQAQGAAGPATPASGPRPSPATVTEFRSLRRGVGIFTGRGGTIGWLSAKDALVVVDTQFPDTASLCLAGLPGRGSRMIDVVLNTHHHADHTAGNGIFKPASHTIVAQANVPKLMFAAAAERAAKTDRPTASGPTVVDVSQQTYPDTTFSDVWRREFGDEIVTAQFFGPAHTGGDAVISFEKANVVHVGDLVFNRIYPVVDHTGGGNIKGWITRLEEVAKTYPADAIYVCGHGNPKFGVTLTHAELHVLRDYWSAVLDYVQKGMAAGKSSTEIAALENLPGFEDFHAPRPNRLASNLSAAYEELNAG